MNDLQIAREATIRPIAELVEQLGIPAEATLPYGHHIAKINTDVWNGTSPAGAKKGKLILVSAMSPTPAGEGKTTTSIGLADGLNLLGKKTIVALREPSLGPVFGAKGGATGGGYAQVMPMEEINLHFTGDFSAIEKANNLLAALADNHLHHAAAEALFSPKSMLFKRVMDMNDRALRDILVGNGPDANGVLRAGSFDITPASEVMAILCLSKDRADLTQRLGNIIVASGKDKLPVTAAHIHAQGAMSVLLKHAFYPNLVQTLEGNPALLHGGPFANIAQGTNSIAATSLALNLADYVVTEAGFGFDLGGEKFLDIKCRQAGFWPEVVVVVATIRSIKYQSGVPVSELTTPDPAALKEGFANLAAHIENVKKFGIKPVVALNRFVSDTEEEIETLKSLCEEHGASISICTHWAEGGKGAVALAEQVLQVIDNQDTPTPQYLYNLEDSPVEKITKIATNYYGASEVDFSPQAERDLRRIERFNLNHLPICIAKNQYSFSDNAKLLGGKHNLPLQIRQIEIAAGAGFIIPIAGDILRMPGLPKVPAANHMSISSDGNIDGLF